MKLNERVTYPNFGQNYKMTTHNEHKLNRFSAPITGIEIEVEGVDRDSASDRINNAWTVTTDGSLRNGGAEFISKPLNPEYVESALHYLYTKTFDNEIHFSPRTSVHVHLDCRKLTFNQVYNIVILYQSFESLLYNFAGKERKKSIYCVPLSNSMFYLEFAKAMSLYEFPQWNKYTGLNLARLHELGTVEFRHLRGTYDYKIICTWLEILYKLYNFAINIDTSKLQVLIINTRSHLTFLNLIHNVFEEHTELLIKNENWTKEMKQDLSISKLFMSQINLERNA